MYSYAETIIPVHVRHRIHVKDNAGIYKIVYGAFVAGLALIISLGGSGAVFLASAIGPDAVEGHIVNITAKIEMPFGAEEQVVLNEILPNPEGPDSQNGLSGEWVELYNNGSASVDVANWYIEDDSVSGNTQIISALNTHTGSTIIGAQGSGSEWLVIFVNGPVLNNNGDTVFLYDDGDILKGSHIYGDSSTDPDSDSNTSAGGDNDTPSGSETAGNEGKSIARIPDGTGAWVDPIPTPGGPNQMEEIELLTVEPVSPIEVVEEIVSVPAETPEEIPVETEAPTAAQEEPATTEPAESPAEPDIEAGPPACEACGGEPVVVEEPPATVEEPPAPTEPPSEEPVVTEEPAAASDSPEPVV